MQVVSHDDVLRGTQTVRVRRLEVLKKLQENRDGHRDIFEDALEGFHTAVVAQLTQALKDAKAGKKYTTSIHLPQPMDHTRDYDRCIAMLDMSLDEELELTSVEFAQFVLDDWGWKGDFITTSANYTNTVR
jgi:hypothetical protein